MSNVLRKVINFCLSILRQMELTVSAITLLSVVVEAVAGCGGAGDDGEAGENGVEEG